MSTLAVSICSSRPPPTGSTPSLHSRESFGGIPHAPPSSSPAQPPLSRQRSDQPGASHSPSPSAHTAHRTSFLICALFHDVDDGPELGRLIASELLAAFQEQFGASLARIGGGTPHINLNEFESFHARVPGILRGLVGPALTRLAACRGIDAALLLTDESRIAFCTADGVDSLGLCANLVAVAALAEDAMGLRGDCLRTAELEGGPGAGTRILVRRLRYTQATLVTVCRTAVRRRVCDDAVAAAAALCDKCFRLMDNLCLQR